MEAPQTRTLEPSGASALITQHIAPQISSLLFSSSLFETSDFPSTEQRTGALLLRPEARFWERTQPHTCRLPAARWLQPGGICSLGQSFEWQVCGVSSSFVGFKML